MIDRALRKFVMKRWTIKGHKIGTLDILLLLGMTWVGIMMRYACRDVETQDYTVCFVPWIDAFRQRGIEAFRGDIFDYTMPYMTFLYIISKTSYSSLYLIKIFSSIFDFILAVLCALIVWEYTHKAKRSYLIYGIFFCLPTVAVNSGLWGQCDVIYVTFVVASFYALIKDKTHASMLLYGIAFAIKLQALFVFPFYAYLWSKKKIKLYQFLYLPAMYMAVSIPALFMGRSLAQILSTYVVQGNTEPWMLSWFWPNIYQLFGPMAFWEYYGSAGVTGTLAILMLLLYFLFKKDVSLDKTSMLKIMLMFAYVVPFFLPYMHERYAYLADALALILLFVKPEKFLLPIVMVITSFVAYTGYLGGETAVPLPALCFTTAIVVSYLVWQVFTDKPFKDIIRTVTTDDRR